MPENIKFSCPSCGTAAIESDSYCRKCGARLFSGNEILIRRGRNIVITVVIISLCIEFLGYLADTSFSFLNYFIRISIEIVILYLIYRGSSSARWLLGIGGIGGFVLGVYYLTTMTFYNFDVSTLSLVVTAGLSASIAGLLLIPKSVRVFQNAQRNSKKKGDRL